jgi:hypothetical protein
MEAKDSLLQQWKLANVIYTEIKKNLYANTILQTGKLQTIRQFELYQQCILYAHYVKVCFKCDWNFCYVRMTQLWNSQYIYP